MRLLFLACFVLFSAPFVFGQSIAIGSTGAVPDPSAILDVQSTQKGILIPRMNTTQRSAIVNPATGLLVFDTTTISLWFYNGSNWKEMQGVGTPNLWLPHANGIYYNGGKVGVGTTPHSIVPMTIFQPNSTTGNAVLHLKSDDIWHTALTMFNGDPSSPTQKFYSFILGGPNNHNALHGAFGLFNHNTNKWCFNVHPTTNYMAIGATSNFDSNTPKSRLHVFAGDVNIDQIGSGIIMKSPNGNCWRITIDDTGTLVRTAIACP